jgi:hypothetical protein
MQFRPLFAIGAVLLGGSAFAADPPDFDRAIAPLLAKRCLDCHSGAKPKGGLDLSRREPAFDGGDSGPAFVPGKPDDSPLWLRVRDAEMPPKRPLPEAERNLLKAWVAAGAKWGSDRIDPFRFTTDARAGYDWWALQPVVRPTVPANARNPIDHFIQAKLDAKGLKPAPEADRRTLIRRLTFDLTGLPPTPDEIDVFVKDESPDAYAKLADRLLASPAYGERWARHWLDVVRYGESNGFERDLPRPNAWPYRDWVVSAFNADMPYDQFVRTQLAGDRTRVRDGLAATGFLVAGPHNLELPVGEAMRESMRQDEMEDLIGTAAQAFLGLTVNCARCHDHKFDPISQKDYYRLVASLNGVGHGERDFPLPDDLAGEMELKRDKAERRRAVYLHDLELIESPVREAILAERKQGKVPAPLPPRPFAEWDFRTGPDDRVGKLHAAKQGEARLSADGLGVDGKAAFAATVPLTTDLKAKTLEAWVRLANLKQRGGAAVSVQTLDGAVFDAIVFGEREPGRWMAGSDGFQRTQSFEGPEEAKADRELVHVAIVYQSDGTIVGYRDGQPYGKSYKSRGVTAFTAGKAQVVFGLRHAPAGGNKMLAGVVQRARVYDRALTPDEVAASAGAVSTFVSDAEILSRLSDERIAARADVLVKIAGQTAELEKLEAARKAKVYTAVAVPPKEARVLLRGNVTTPGEAVTAGGIAALGRADFGLPSGAPEGDRRIKLADWVTAKDNPLFARVIVNRLWHYHFGQGIVDTPNDFGFNGGRPSHPELLDWLADEFVRGGYSLKAMHRTMVLSDAYRRSSRPDPAAEAVDAGNRLLWRANPRRLEAEAVRDAMLAVSGKLDRTVGGPGYSDVKSYFFKGSQFYEPLEQTGPAFYRRTLYRMSARSGRSPFLDTFDCPDPSTTTPRRAMTTTPLQALALLNNAFVLHTADCLAERLRKDAGDDTSKQIDLAFRLAYGRSAGADEIAKAKPFAAKHGLPAFCRVLFNTNEFLYVD